MLGSIRTIQAGAIPRFGCRQIAFMTEGAAATPEQQAMLLDALRDNPNSLKVQSGVRPNSPRDGIQAPLHQEDLLEAPQEGNPDGWGMAAYCALENPVQIQKSLKPASQDAKYDTAAEQISASAPRTVLAHILNKVDAARHLEDEDVHPFSFDKWTSMFNGVLTGGRTPEMTNAAYKLYAPILNATPKATNTGEKILLYFLGKLKKNFGTLDSKTLGLPKLHQMFAETLRDFLKMSKPLFTEVTGSVMGIKGMFQYGPSCNYVVTDGDVLMAYRQGRKLYLNRHETTEGKSGYLVSSEPIQPKDKPLQWVELPQDHIFTLQRKPDGKIEPTLTPFLSALKPVSEIKKGDS